MGNIMDELIDVSDQKPEPQAIEDQTEESEQCPNCKKMFDPDDMSGRLCVRCDSHMYDAMVEAALDREETYNGGE